MQHFCNHGYILKDVFLRIFLRNIVYSFFMIWIIRDNVKIHFSSYLKFLALKMKEL